MLRPCSIADCGHPAERASGSCIICARHFCANHSSDRTHTCPTSDDDGLDKYYDAYDAAKSRHLKALLNKVNVTALESAASSARNGFACRIPALADDISEAARIEVVSSKCGGQNCHVDVEFADGVTWIARIRLDDPLLPPHPVQAHIFLSEVATLSFLFRTRVPAPQVYAYALEGPENSVGTSYVLMQKLSGRPFDWPSTTPEQRNKVIEQLADVFLELERHPLPLTGSLALTRTDIVKASPGEIRKTLDRAYGKHETTKSITCRGLTRNPKDGNRVRVLFQSVEEAERVRENQEWLGDIPDARLSVERGYPVNP